MPAINRPTSKEEIEEKVTKLGNTPFKVEVININVPDNIFISMKVINDTRRVLTEKLINERKKINRVSKSSIEKLNYNGDKVNNYICFSKN